MPKSGGYRVLDLAHTPLSNFAVVYPGIYDYIEESNKMCIVSGLFAGGVEYDDFAVLFTGGTTLTAKVTDSLELVITDEDKVTVAVKEPAESTDSVDFTGVTVPADGAIQNAQLVIKVATLIANRKPFYLKNIDFTQFLQVGGSQLNLEVLYANSTSAEGIHFGAFYHEGGVLYFIDVEVDTNQLALVFSKKVIE